MPSSSATIERGSYKLNPISNKPKEEMKTKSSSKLNSRSKSTGYIRKVDTDMIMEPNMRVNIG